MAEYEKMTGDELRDILKQRGLPQQGNKEEMVARIELNDAERADAGQTPAQEGGDEGGTLPSQPPGDGLPQTDPDDPELAPGAEEEDLEEAPDPLDAIPAQRRPENQDETIKKMGVLNERGQRVR